MRGRRMVNELPSAMRHNDRAIEQFEADRGHDEKVRRGNPVRMVAQEGPPTLAKSSGTFDHVLGDSRLGDLDAELEQQEEAERINQDMALAARDFLARIKALWVERGAPI